MNAAGNNQFRVGLSADFLDESGLLGVHSVAGIALTEPAVQLRLLRPELRLQLAHPCDRLIHDGASLLEQARLLLVGLSLLGHFGQRLLGFLQPLLDFNLCCLLAGPLFGELLRLLLKLLVGLLQLLLLRLQFSGELLRLLQQAFGLQKQFSGELLRLLQQAFGLHRGFDAVEHDTDAVGELLEEGHL